MKDAKGEDVTEGGAPFQVYITLTDKRRPKKKAKPEEKPNGTPIPQKQVGDISVEVYDNGDGTYDCHHKTDAGKITIKVKLNGQKVAKSPYNGG